jgi:L-threonylcarbamoyladenylate synthase
MRCIPFTTSTKHAALRAAVRVLRQGGVIAFPTETTYGLGCDPRNARAVARVFRIKGRDRSKPLLLVADTVARVQKVAVLNAVSRRIGRRHWPGPLTLVLPVRSGTRLQKGVTPKGDVAVRVSSSRIVRKLVAAYGFPIIATSANQSDMPDCRSGRAVRQAFMQTLEQPDLLLDVGALPRRAPSTVAKILSDGTAQVFRTGAVRLS